jgi:hypothetical protein
LGDIVVAAVVFDLPWPVEKKLFNFDGGEEDSVPINLLSTGEWAMVVLKKKTFDMTWAAPALELPGPATTNKRPLMLQLGLLKMPTEGPPKTPTMLTCQTLTTTLAPIPFLMFEVKSCPTCPSWAE